MSYKRWLFTLNNPSDVDCASFFSLPVTGDTDGPALSRFCAISTGVPAPGVRRGVIGKEVAPTTGTDHLQGYLEFHDRKSLRGVKQLCNKAHWEAAKGGCGPNYRYCVKDGQWISFGNWPLRDRVSDGTRSKSDQHTRVLCNVLQDAVQDYFFEKQYSSRKSTYDELRMEYNSAAELTRRFDHYRTKMLSPFQMLICRRMFVQNTRKILWISDTSGGSGKTFLAHFLNACYGYDLIDGITKTSDVAYLLSSKPKGIVFDVTRADSSHFNYATLEACKNGFVMSGKYKGIKRVFEPVPVSVFANFEPDLSKLTSDRWDIITVNQDGICSPSYKDYTEDPESVKPFCPPRSIIIPSEEKEDKENAPPRTKCKRLEVEI